MNPRQKATLAWSSTLLVRVVAGIALVAAGSRSSTIHDVLQRVVVVAVFALPLAVPLAFSGRRELLPSTPVFATVRRLRIASGVLVLASVVAGAVGFVGDQRWLAVPLALGLGALILADHREAGVPDGAWRTSPPAPAAVRAVAWLAAFGLCGVLAYLAGLWVYG